MGAPVCAPVRVPPRHLFKNWQNWLNGQCPRQGAEDGEEEVAEAREGGGGFDDQYDMDDDFIDDTEIHDYYGGDRRKTKYTGFFMNKARHAAPPAIVQEWERSITYCRATQRPQP